MWALIQNDAVIELTDIDPKNRFHPSVLWVPVGESGAQVGWAYQSGIFKSSPTVVTVQDIKSAVTDLRWKIETGGLTLPGGVQVATALDDQNRITTVVANARLAGLDSVKFKAASGWVTLSVAEVEAIAAAIAMHVQACFAAECAHHEAIDALANAHAHDDEALQTALNAYDTSQGWPAADLREPASA